MNLKPQNNQIIISWKNQSKEDLAKDMQKAGLTLPEETQGREQMIEMGEVMACADNLLDIHDKPIILKKGDKILFATFTTFDLVLEDKEAFAINAKDIIAIL